MNVSRSGYYAWVCKEPKPGAGKDAVLLAMIRRVERTHNGNYGVRRVVRVINDEYKHSCSRSRVQRVMHENGIKGKQISKYKPQMTKADASAKAYPNLIKQKFAVEGKNRVWLADITYVRVNGAWSYLGAVLDLGRRKIVGWQVGANPNARLACSALKKALKKERPGSGVIHHSDRGCQYTSNAYSALLKEHSLVGSMSGKGNPYDNAPMESFFQTLKTECLNRYSFRTIEELEMCLKAWIDVYYNCERLHSALGYKSPLSYEISMNQPFPLSA